MLAVSAISALAAGASFMVALYELAGIWWALLACSFLLAAIAVVTGYAADVAQQEAREREAR